MVFAIAGRKLSSPTGDLFTPNCIRSLLSAIRVSRQSSVINQLNIVNEHDKFKDQNTSDEEWRANENLKYESIMILPADKGIATVVMNKNDYYEKCRPNEHLRDEKSYQKLKSDPTNKFKKEFVSNQKDLKDRKVMDHALGLHMKLYPTVDQLPRFYGLPKIHKVYMPMRLIISSIGTNLRFQSFTTDQSWYFTLYWNHLLPISGDREQKTEHHVRNSKYFTKDVCKLKIAPEEGLRSYNVSALFISIPVNRALVALRQTSK